MLQIQRGFKKFEIPFSFMTRLDRVRWDSQIERVWAADSCNNTGVPCVQGSRLLSLKVLKITKQAILRPHESELQDANESRTKNHRQVSGELGPNISSSWLLGPFVGYKTFETHGRFALSHKLVKSQSPFFSYCESDYETCERSYLSWLKLFSKNKIKLAPWSTHQHVAVAIKALGQSTLRYVRCCCFFFLITKRMVCLRAS